MEIWKIAYILNSKFAVYVLLEFIPEIEIFAKKPLISNPPLLELVIGRSVVGSVIGRECSCVIVMRLNPWPSDRSTHRQVIPLPIDQMGYNFHGANERPNLTPIADQSERGEHLSPLTEIEQTLDPVHVERRQSDRLGVVVKVPATEFFFRSTFL